MDLKKDLLSEYCLTSDAILGSLNDGIYITDRDRRILYWSDAAERITGWSREEVVGKSCRDNILAHVDKDGRPLCGKEHCPLHRTIVSGKPTKVPIIVYALTRDGRRVPMSVYTSPLRDSTGEVVAAVEIFRDMSHLMGELQRAKTIQRSSLVLKIAEDPRLQVRTLYAPHDIVGGDFYSAQDIPDDSVAFMIADVMGHGIGSALYSMFFRMLWYEYESSLGAPSDFLAKLDQRIHPLIKDNFYFATAAAMVLNKETGVLVHAGAGHPPLLIFREGGEVDQLDCSAFPLGLMGEGEYKNTSTQLSPGDCVLLYTDGLVEQFDKDGEEHGTEGLIRAVHHCRKANGDLRLRDVEEYLLTNSRDIRPADDVTMLWIRYNGLGKENGKAPKLT